MRDGSLPFVRIKHIDLANKVFTVDPREMPVKGGRYYVSCFFPVPTMIFEIFSSYYDEMLKQHCFCPNDPLFPKLSLHKGDDGVFTEGGFSRDFMSDAQILVRICKDAFHKAGLEKFSPHKIRHTLLELGKQKSQNPLELKAWSQNIGHVDTRHMMETYGQLDHARQIEVMARFDSDGPILA